MNALAKAAQQAGILSQAQQSLTLQQRIVFGRLVAKGIDREVAAQLARAIEKSAKPLGAAFSRAKATGKDQSKQARRRRANAYLKEQGHEVIGKAKTLAKAAYHRAFVNGAKAKLDTPVFDALRLAARASAGGKASGLKRRADKDENKQALMAQRDQLKESLRAVEVELAKMAPLPDEVAADELIAPKAKRKRTLAERAMDAACKPQAQPVAKSHRVTIVKAEERPWQKIVHSVVYEPDVPDTDDDFMTAEDIEKMAHAAMKGGVLINHEHTPTDVGAHVVESYIAPADFMVHGPDGAAHAIRKGSWVMGLQVTNDETWGRILSGEYGGFSMEGSALRQA